MICWGERNWGSTSFGICETEKLKYFFEIRHFNLQIKIFGQGREFDFKNQMTDLHSASPALKTALCNASFLCTALMTRVPLYVCEECTNCSKNSKIQSCCNFCFEQDPYFVNQLLFAAFGPTLLQELFDLIKLYTQWNCIAQIDRKTPQPF